MEETQKYRLITRSNFDGIINTALLLKLDLVDEILYVHPKEVQEGKVAIGENDIVTNLPYVKDAFMAFDHKLETHDAVTLNKNHALYTDAGSVSEVIYEYYGAKEVFGEELHTLVEAANKSKSAAFEKEEVLSPAGWDLLIFLTDPRTGLGRFKEFAISNYALMQKLPKLCLELTIDEILKDEDVQERVILCKKHEKDFTEQIKRCTKVEGDVALIDFRDEEVIYPGNRFMVYALFPEISASVHILQGVENQNTVLAVGKSIFNHDNKKDIYEIVSKFQGGGHTDAGTCQVPHQDAEAVMESLLLSLRTR